LFLCRCGEQKFTKNVIFFLSFRARVICFINYLFGLLEFLIVYCLPSVQVGWLSWLANSGASTGGRRTLFHACDINPADQFQLSEFQRDADNDDICWQLQQQ